jgi:hypothetical protein
MSQPRLLDGVRPPPVANLALTLRQPFIRHASTVISIVYLIWVWQFVVAAGSHVDADAYRLVDPTGPYTITHAGAEHAFLYAPVVAQLLGIVNWVPAEVFYAGLAALSIGSLVYLVGPRWAGAALVLPLAPLWQDLMTGNIHLILAAATVVGFRHSAAWSFVLLTKVTPGIGLVWFVIRREWRAFGLALVATLIAVLLSLLIAPQLWGEWLQLLLTNSTGSPQGLSVPLPLASRLIVALVLVIWGARGNHRWTVPAAAFIGLPIIWLYDGLAVLAGVAGVLYHSRSQHG